MFRIKVRLTCWSEAHPPSNRTVRANVHFPYLVHRTWQLSRLSSRVECRTLTSSKETFVCWSVKWWETQSLTWCGTRKVRLSVQADFSVHP